MSQKTQIPFRQIPNKESWTVVASCGDWHQDVPKEMVCVCARCHLQDGQGATKDRYFLVPASEYKTNAMHAGFVIDPAGHKEIPPLK